MNDWGWQESGPASAAVSSAPAGGIQAEILRRQNMRLNPTAGNPFQVTPEQRAGILSQQMQQPFKNAGMVQMQPNNGRPVGGEFANGVQMNPIMGGMKSEIRQPAPMQPFQQLPPGGGASSWNAAFSQANGMPVNNKWDPAGQQAYLRQIAGNNPGQSRFNMSNGTQPTALSGMTIRNDLDTPEKELAYRMSRGLMPNTTQQAISQGAQQNQQQQLMALLSNLLNRG